MCYARSLDHSGAFQFNWLSAEMLEQSDALSQQDGHQIDGYFVKQSHFYALLHDLRGGYDDILIPCCMFCLANGTFNAICDEGERRSSLDPFLWDAMGNNKARYVTTRRISGLQDMCRSYPAEQDGDGHRMSGSWPLRISR